MSNVQKPESGRQKPTPEGWEVTELGDIVKTFSGGTPSRTKPEYFGGTIPWIKSGELNSGVITKTEEFITKLGLENSSAKIVKPNTLLIALYGATAGVVGRSAISAAINQAVLAVEPSDRVDSVFLEYSLRFKASESLHLTQGGQPNFSAEIVKKFSILLPPLPEQVKIASILSEWDDSLFTLSKLIEAKRQQKRGLAEQLLTGKRRLKGFSGEWEEKELGQVAEIDSDSLGQNTDQDYQFHYLSLSEVNRGQITFPNEKISFSEAPSRARRKVRQGDVLLGTVRPNLQAFAILKNQVADLIVSTGFSAIRAHEFSDSEFIYQSLYSSNITQQIDNLITGSNYPAISSADVKKLKLNCPPLPEQQAIASVLSTLDAEISSLEALKASVQGQKRGLMDLLLTGKVRVKVEEA